MNLQIIDWSIIAVFFVIVLSIGFVASRTAGKSTQEFFLGGRGMRWWLLGISLRSSVSLNSWRSRASASLSMSKCC